MWRDTFEELRNLEMRMNQLFDELMGERIGLPAAPAKLGVREPYADIIETDREVKVTIEIPGVDKKDIDLNATENSLEVSAEMKEEEKEEKEGYIRKERRYNKYYRAFALPEDVDPTKAKTTFKNGILQIVLPKKRIEERTTIKV
ncbi:spore protein SP21 [archaeon]|nr:spore protein SP21 [archaeon]